MAIVLIVTGLAIAGHVAIGLFIWNKVRNAESTKNKQDPQTGEETQ